MKDLTVKELFGLYDNRINVGDFKEADEFKAEIMSRFYKMEKEIDVLKMNTQVNKAD